MSFPFIYLLYAYYVFLAVWLVFCLIVVYHLLKYGFKNLFTLSAAVIFSAVSFLLVSGSFYYINGIDWMREIIIF